MGSLRKAFFPCAGFFTDRIGWCAPWLIYLHGRSRNAMDGVMIRAREGAITASSTGRVLFVMKPYGERMPFMIWQLSWDLMMRRCALVWEARSSFIIERPLPRQVRAVLPWRQRIYALLSLYYRKGIFYSRGDFFLRGGQKDVAIFLATIKVLCYPQGR